MVFKKIKTKTVWTIVIILMVVMTMQATKKEIAGSALAGLALSNPGVSLGVLAATFGGVSAGILPVGALVAIGVFVLFLMIGPALLLAKLSSSPIILLVMGFVGLIILMRKFKG